MPCYLIYCLVQESSTVVPFWFRAYLLCIELLVVLASLLLFMEVFVLLVLYLARCCFTSDNDFLEYYFGMSFSTL